MRNHWMVPGRSRWAVSLAILAATLLLAACGGDNGAGNGSETASDGATQPEAERQREKLSIQFTWLPNPGFAPVLLAEERGYFEDEALDVTITPGGGGVSAPQLIVSGKADIAVGAVDDVPASRAEGIPLVSLAVMERYSPSALIVREDSPIKDPKDFAGKTITTKHFDASGVLLPAYLEAVGVDPASVTVNTVDASTQSSLFAAGQIDIATGFTRDEAVSIEIGRGVPIRVFPYIDAGIRFPSTGIFTTQDVLDAEPDLIRRAVRAILRGYADGVEDPEAAVAAAKARFPEQYENVEVAEAHAHKFAENIRNHLPEEGLGYQRESDWEEGLNLLVKYFGLEEPERASAYFTNDFLPEEPLLTD